MHSSSREVPRPDAAARQAAESDARKFAPFFADGCTAAEMMQLEVAMAAREHEAGAAVTSPQQIPALFTDPRWCVCCCMTGCADGWMLWQSGAGDVCRVRVGGS